MATEAQLIQALKKADEQGNFEDAARFAEMIKAQRAAVVPSSPIPASAGMQRSKTIDKQITALRERPDPQGRIGEITTELATVQPQGDMGKIQPLVDELNRLKGQRETRAVKELPELGSEVGIAQILGDTPVAKQAAVSLGLVSMTDPVEIAQALMKASPDIGITEDEAGNLIATNNALGISAMINKPDLSKLDVMQGVGRVAAFTPAGRLPGIVAPAAGATATEAVLQATEMAAGGDFNPEALATEGLTTAGGLSIGKVFNYGKLTPKQQGILKELEVNPRDPDLAKYLIVDGKPQANKALNDAIKKFGDARPIALIKAANKPDRAATKEMIKILRKGASDPQYANDVRVGTVVGKSLAKRLSATKAALKEAGQEVDNAVRGDLAGQRVDITDSLGNFKSALSDLRVSFDPKTGDVDFTGSALEGAGGGQSRDLIRRVARLLKGGNVSAKDAHFAKQLIDQKTAFGTSDSGISGKISNAIKGLRSQINSDIGDSIPTYAEANKKYSTLIDALNAFQDAVGSKIDLDNAAQLGLKARSFASNNQNRERMRPALEKLQNALSEYGVKFDDDILTQSNIANFLESRFKFASPSNSLRGEAAKAGKDVFERGVAPTVLQRGLDVITATPSDKEAIDALFKILGD